ncbi:MAG: thioredoxin family protein [Clostridia bacterium]
MGLFSKKNKKVESEPVVQAKPVAQANSDSAIQSVKILGGGCAKCNELENATVQALSQLGINIEIEHVTDFSVIATYGVMTTPAIVVNEKVISYGKVLKPAEVVKLIEKLL